MCYVDGQEAAVNESPKSPENGEYNILTSITLTHTSARAHTQGY